jgi:cellobiose-specific phosphotransferase system component IIC
MDAEVSTHTFLKMIIEESVCFMSCEPIFVCAIILMWYTRNIYIYIFFINWTLRMSDNLPERVQILGHAHILCITVRENRNIFCQIFCDLLLKSAFERISNVIQLILVKIKWHIKWKYLIQKFHDICLSYYFKCIGDLRQNRV